MANIKFSDLTANPSIADTDIFAVSKNGAGSRRSTAAEVKEYMSTSEDNIYYVGKSGSDTNSGLTIGDSFLTIQKGIDTADLQTPSATDQYVVKIQDGGAYDSFTLTSSPYVSLDAQGCQLQSTGSTYILGDDNSVVFNKATFVSGSGVLIQKNGSSRSYLSGKELSGASATTAIRVSIDSTLYANVDYLNVTTSNIAIETRTDAHSYLTSQQIIGKIALDVDAHCYIESGQLAGDISVNDGGVLNIINNGNYVGNITAGVGSIINITTGSRSVGFSDTIDASAKVNIFIMNTGASNIGSELILPALGAGVSTLLYPLQADAPSATLGVPLLIDNSTGGATAATGIRFRASSGEATDIRAKAGIFFERTEAGGVGSLHLAVDGTNDDSNADLTDAKLTIDSDGNVSIRNSTPTLIFNDTSSNIFTIGSLGNDQLDFVNPVVGHSAEYRFFTADGDGTDELAFLLYGVGSPSDVTNSEYLALGYDTGGIFVIESVALGTGTLRDLDIRTGSNFNQILLEASGDVSIANDLAVKGNVTIGDGAAGVDYTLTFDGEDNDGVITWLEDEDAFDMSCGFSLNAGQIVTEFSTDGTLVGDSDAAIPTEKAVKTYVDAQAGSGYWTRTVTTLSPTTAGDNLDMGSGTITTTGQITGGDLDITGTTTTLLGTSIDTTGGNFTVNGTGGINIATDANTSAVHFASGSGTRDVYLGGANTDLTISGYDVDIHAATLHFSGIDGKGELIVCDGTKSRALAVGADDEVLVADSATSTGLKWAASSPFERTVTTISPVTAGDDLDMGSGEITTTDTITCGDLYIQGSTPTLRFIDSSSDNFFIKTDGDDELHFSSDVSGSNSFFRFFSKDGDGTDTVAINLFGVGSSGSLTNQESLKIEYNTGYELFQIYSSNTGTGTLQALRLGAGTNVTSSQLALSTDGRVGMTVAAPLAQLHIDQKEDDEAIPVLALDQADISEGFINFIGSDRGVITGATSSAVSVRVELSGTVYRLALYADA